MNSSRQVQAFSIACRHKSMLNYQVMQMMIRMIQMYKKLSLSFYLSSLTYRFNQFCGDTPNNGIVCYIFSDYCTRCNNGILANGNTG